MDDLSKGRAAQTTGADQRSILPLGALWDNGTFGDYDEPTVQTGYSDLGFVISNERRIGKGIFLAVFAAKDGSRLQTATRCRADFAPTGD